MQRGEDGDAPGTLFEHNRARSFSSGSAEMRLFLRGSLERAARQSHREVRKLKTPVSQRLLKVLAKIDRPGTFCTSGQLSPIFPGLEVAGIGTIGLPLETRQAKSLKKLAHQAPYGKGTGTLVDTKVRRVWEIDATQVVLTNPEWPAAVKQAVESVQSALGLENQKLDAHLYKLLIYETGSFFLAHRDGEKLDRMVSTLVIALPSIHEGGQHSRRAERD